MSRKNHRLISFILLLTYTGVFFQEVLANAIEAPAVAFYIAERNETALFGETLQTQWQKENLSVVLLHQCLGSPGVSQRLECIKKTMQSDQYRNKKILWMLSEEYAHLASAALQHPDGLQSLSSIILLRSGEGEVPKGTAGKSSWNLLIVNLSSDSAQQIQYSRQHAQQFRQAGISTWFTLLIPSDKQDFKIHEHPTLSKMAAFQVFGVVDTLYDIQFKAESFWQEPPIDNRGFVEQGEFSVTRPVDPLLYRTFHTFYESEPFFLKQWPFETYKALDLLKFRDALPKEKQGRYLSFKNPKGHHFYLDLNRYGRYKPVIVYQLDDETNLYRMARFYRTRQYYSWLPEKGGPSEEDLYVEPLGAFLHFLEPLPAQYEIPRLQYTAIRYESIEFTNQNPFRYLTGMSFPLYRIASRNCISCHTIDGVGGNAGHLDAFSLQKKEGFALPLRAYDPAVLREFFFDQQSVANRIGVRPNFVPPQVASELMEWLRIPRSNQ